MYSEGKSDLVGDVTPDSSPEIEVVTEEEVDCRLLVKQWYTTPAKQMRLAEEYDEARELLLDGLSQFPHNSHLLCSLGEIYKCTGDMFEAMNQFRKALKADPKNPVPLNSIAHTYHLLGEYEKARRCYTEVLRKDPYDRFALTGVGQSYRMEGYYVQARNSFRAVLERYPSDEIARELLFKLEMEV